MKMARVGMSDRNPAMASFFRAVLVDWRESGVTPGAATPNRDVCSPPPLPKKLPDVATAVASCCCPSFMMAWGIDSPVVVVTVVGVPTVVNEIVGPGKII